jgi:diguanylate cyclase (GGDEF)-like protein
MTQALEAGELRSLARRLLELERERSEARDQARLLLALQDAFARIAVTRTPAHVVAQMLRAGYTPLGFSRGIFFSIDRAHGVEARWQLDGSETVEPSHEIVDLRPGGAILRALRGEIAQCVGRAEDLSAPLVDTRGWYVLSTLTHAEGTLGLLYLDGHRSRDPREWEMGLVRALATLAAVSIDNSLLLERTEELATRDPLTGLLNRRAFSQKLNEALEKCHTTGRSLTYVLIDVDDFKRINDTHGHAQGDAVLQHLAQTLVRSSRADDVVGRYAGDEFVVLLPNIDPGEIARVLVGRLSADLRMQGLRCSLGAAIFPKDAIDAEGLLSAADRALYATKAAGKNGFSFA